jgi:hypothetical protein
VRALLASSGCARARALLVIALFASFGCARVATRADGTRGESVCPSLRGHEEQLDSVGGLTTRETCRSGETCSSGPYDCRCDVAHGGAPRPNWWSCHRARDKRDGCSDDEALLRGDVCPREGQQCQAPRACGCSSYLTVTCREGRWTPPAACEPCLAP